MVKHVSSKFFQKKRKKGTSNNSDFFEEGYDDRTLKKYPITENLKRNSWRDLLDKWFFLPKNGKLDLVRKNTIEKNKQKKGTKQKKEIEPTKFYKER